MSGFFGFLPSGTPAADTPAPDQEVGSASFNSIFNTVTGGVSNVLTAWGNSGLGGLIGPKTSYDEFGAPDYDESDTSNSLTSSFDTKKILTIAGIIVGGLLLVVFGWKIFKRLSKKSNG